MATIPIEVILQDAEAPVDPTPTPEETNIVVPDTGAGTVGSGGTFSSSSTASIILPAILLVAALITVCTLLIHKHRKHQNSDKINKKEKLATAASGTIAILAATVLVGNLVIPATSAATDDTNANREGELVVDDKITITVTREADSDEAIVSSIDTKSYATVYKTFGYEVAIAMADNTTNLYLDGDESSDYYFSPVEDGTLADNTWGYTLDGEEYTAMPLIDNLAVVSKGTAPVSNEEVDINYGVKVASDMPAGTYTGELEYILADTGFPAALRTMQDMTTAICSSVPTPNPFKADNTTIEDNVPTIMLPDSRDNKLYRVAKLADGKCWMTQNLDLDLISDPTAEEYVALTPANTNITADWTPANSTISFTGTSVPSWQDSYTAPYSADPGDVYYYTSNTNDNDIKYNSLTECEAAGHTDCAHYHAGNYYNWSAAVANNNTAGITKQYTNVETSICPAGWRLPKNRNAGSSIEGNEQITQISSYDGILGEYQWGTYNYLEGGFNAIRSNPLWLARSGSVHDGSLYNTGSYGNYWSSTVYDSRDAYQLPFGSGYVTPDGIGVRNVGYAVRCVAQ